MLPIQDTTVDIEGFVLILAKAIKKLPHLSPIEVGEARQDNEGHVREFVSTIGYFSDFVIDETDLKRSKVTIRSSVIVTRDQDLPVSYETVFYASKIAFVHFLEQNATLFIDHNQ